MRAVGLTIASLRQIERGGASGMLDRALDGFKALPEARSWRDILQMQGEHPTRAEITEQFRLLASTHHPDKGGDTTTFAAITQAYHEALGASGA